MPYSGPRCRSVSLCDQTDALIFMLEPPQLELEVPSTFAHSHCAQAPVHVPAGVRADALSDCRSASAPKQRGGRANEGLGRYACGKVFPLITGRLGFASFKNQAHRKESARPEIRFFTTELHDMYEPLCCDFGPVDLGIVYRFCSALRQLMEDNKNDDRMMVYHVNDDPVAMTNAAFLLGAFLIVVEGLSAEEAFHPFACMQPYPFLAFRDAMFQAPDAQLPLLECFRGLEKGTKLGWFDLNSFDIQAYEFWGDPESGDLHKVSPKFVAFRGPIDEDKKSQNDTIFYTPAHYMSKFRMEGITAVIRLNEPDHYQASSFVNNGIAHYDLEFQDGHPPPREVVNKFLEICVREKGLAVHCRAGLGRTGCLIACYMMAFQGFTADDAVAWLRIMRPGMVTGSQHLFLRDLENSHYLPQLLKTQSAGRRKKRFAKDLSDALSKSPPAKIDLSQIGHLEDCEGSMKRGTPVGTPERLSESSIDAYFSASSLPDMDSEPFSHRRSSWEGPMECSDWEDTPPAPVRFSPRAKDLEKAIWIPGPAPRGVLRGPSSGSETPKAESRAPSSGSLRSPSVGSLRSASSSSFRSTSSGGSPKRVSFLEDFSE